MKTSSILTPPELPQRFDAFEIHGVREFREAGMAWCEQVADTEAQFWSIYGHIPGEGFVCIGNFKTRRYAEEVYARLRGCMYDDAGCSSVGRINP